VTFHYPNTVARQGWFSLSEDSLRDLLSVPFFSMALSGPLASNGWARQTGFSGLRLSPPLDPEA